jgi:alkylation response protein AidB-like acyl-CoA dehydrogenase
MLSFAFGPEQEDFRVQLRRFAVAELAPYYIERAARSEFCWEAHRQLASLGYSAEMPLQQRYRDVASYLIADGTAAIQRRIIATSMMGKAAAL